MEQIWDPENAHDSVEMAGSKATDAYPPKLEREETKEETDWPPRLMRLLNPFGLISDIGKQILSDLEKKGKETEAKLQEETKVTADTPAEVTPASKSSSDARSSQVNEHYAEDIARRDATMARYESMQNHTLDQIHKTLERIDKIQEQRDANMQRAVTFDAPKYNGV